MKKNISINICGTIYAIDEDAYQLLEHYLDSMKRYFSQEGDEEIADDIEHRVAELLWEQKKQGKDAVNIEMVKEIMEKIGNPADIADETTAHEDASSTSEIADETEQSAQEDTSNGQNFQERMHEFASDANQAANNAFNKMKDNTKGKRLYRDTSNKMIGGVCSGLAEFFGGDPVLWRLGTALVAILFWWVIGKWWFVPDFVSMLIPILYVCMLVVVPAAKTPEDRIRMKGGQVNPETLKEQVVNDIEASQQAPQRVNNEGSGCLKAIFGIALLCLLFPLFSAFIGLLFALLLAIPAAFGATSAVISVFPELNWLPAVFGTYSPFLILGLISGLYLVGLPIYACVRLLRNTDDRMKSSTIITLIITWLIALALVVYASVFFGLKISAYLDKLYAEEYSREGIELADMDEWQWLDENGWTVFTLNNAENDIVWTYTHLQGISDKGLRINREDKANPITVDMEKTDYYDDGNYVLEVIADVRGQGCTFSAIDENTDAETVATITPGQNGKELKDISFEDFSKLPIVSEPDSISWEGINGEEDENWKYYCSEPFSHTNGDIKIRIKADNTYIDAIHIRMIRLRKIE